MTGYKRSYTKSNPKPPIFEHLRSCTSLELVIMRPLSLTAPILSQPAILDLFSIHTKMLLTIQGMLSWLLQVQVPLTAATILLAHRLCPNTRFHWPNPAITHITRTNRPRFFFLGCWSCFIKKDGSYVPTL